MSLVYCYGVIEHQISVDVKGFEQSKLYFIPFKDISAVVCDVSEETFSQVALDKNIKDMKWLTMHAPVHEKVIEAYMTKTTIIPMKFCTLFLNQDKVTVMLNEKYDVLKENLAHLKGKVEMGVKVYVQVAPIKEKIRKESNIIKELEHEAQKKTSGQAYFIHQKIDTIIKENLSVRLAQEGKDIFNALPGLERHKNELLFKKVTGKDMLLNGVFLIKSDDRDSYKKAVVSIAKKYEYLEFDISGPFCPYTFVREKK